MTRTDRIRRRVLLLTWKVVNPVAAALAGIAPWWIVLETTGAKTGKPRRTPLARGPLTGSTLWLIAVHGDHAAWVRNLRADPRVRVRMKRRWHRGAAMPQPLDDERLGAFSRYARMGPRLVGIDPLLIEVRLGDDGTAGYDRQTPPAP